MSFPPKVNYGALNLICYFAIVYIYTLYGKLFSVLLGVTLITVLDRCQPSSAVSGRFSLGLSGQGKKKKPNEIQTYLLLSSKIIVYGCVLAKIHA